MATNQHDATSVPPAPESLTEASGLDAQRNEDIDKTSPSDTESGKASVANPDAAATTDGSDEPYTVYTAPQKRAICLVVSLCAFLSPVSGSIYYPALTQIERDLGQTADKINITLTTYFIFQGLAPTFVGGFADGSGRRLGYLVCFVVTIAANIGLGAQNSYAALLVLRMVQSAGSSGMVALSQAVVADMVTSQERGQYMAYAALGSLLGPNLGPVLGGIISQNLGWHWIFWVLTIIAAAIFVPVALFLPETNRKIVGNGSFPPPRLLASITSVVQQRRREKQGRTIDEAKMRELHSQWHVTFPDPLGSLRIASDKQAALILLSNGIVVGTMYAFMAGIPTIFQAFYGYDEIIVGLCYLPFGVSNVVSIYTVGRLIDWNYRRHARRLGFPLVHNRRQDLSGFPIERARLEIAAPSLLVGAVALIVYAWLLDKRVPAAGPLVFSGLIGYFCGASFQIANLLMIDSFPDQAGTAAAAGNLFRCWIGALAAGVIQPMFNAMGIGWAYTFWALVWVVYCPMLLLLVKYGPQWRDERKQRMAARAERKEAKKLAKQSKE